MPPWGGLGGALQDHVAALDGGEDVVGDGLTLGLAVLDGQTLDLLQDDAACGDLVGQELLQNTGGVGGDVGADAVAVDDADGDALLGGEIGLFSVHIGDTVLLLFQKNAERLAGLIDIHYLPPSLV